MARKKKKRSFIENVPFFGAAATAGRYLGGGIKPGLQSDIEDVKGVLGKVGDVAKTAYYGPGNVPQPAPQQPAFQPPQVAEPPAQQFLSPDTPLSDAHVQAYSDQQTQPAAETAPVTVTPNDAHVQAFDQRNRELLNSQAEQPEDATRTGQFLGPVQGNEYRGVIQATPEAIERTRRGAARQGLTREGKARLDEQERRTAERQADREARQQLADTQAATQQGVATTAAGAQQGVATTQAAAQQGVATTAAQAQQTVAVTQARAQVDAEVAKAAGGERVAMRNIEAQIQAAKINGDSRTIEGITSSAIKSMSEDMWINDEVTGRQRQATPAEKYAAIKPIMDAATGATQQLAAGSAAGGGADTNNNNIPDEEEGRFSGALAAIQEYEALPENDPRRQSSAAVYEKAKVAKAAYLTKYKQQLG